MPTSKVMTVFVVVLALAVLMPPIVYAQDITNDAQCAAAVKNAEDAITSNPPIGEKFSKILTEVMDLARQRCTEKQYKNAGELLAIVRGMVASG